MNPFNTDTSGQFKETEWNKCFICQEDKSEVLRCPADSKREEKRTGYKTISDLLVRFSNACLLYTSISWHEKSTHAYLLPFSESVDSKNSHLQYH